MLLEPGSDVVEGGWGSSPPSVAEKRTDRRKLFTLFDTSSFLTDNTLSIQMATPGEDRTSTNTGPKKKPNSRRFSINSFVKKESTNASPDYRARYNVVA
jgi:hypothetical protein